MSPKQVVRGPPKPPGEKFVYIGIRLPPDEAKAVKAMAASRTPQQVVRDLVSDALKRARAKKQ